jgi:hypothetical protein
MADLVRNTHALGICALLFAALVTAMRRERGWWALTVLLAGMAAVITTDASWIVHDRVRAMLIGDNIYDSHYAIQIAITGGAALLLLACTAAVVRAERGPRRWAWLGAMALIALFAVQAISVHGVDAVLGRALGPVMIIGWLWAIGAAIVAAAAMAPRRGA